jgi:hypothetical protein
VHNGRARQKSLYSSKSNFLSCLSDLDMQYLMWVIMRVRKIHSKPFQRIITQRPYLRIYYNCCFMRICMIVSLYRRTSTYLFIFLFLYIYYRLKFGQFQFVVNTDSISSVDIWWDFLEWGYICLKIYISTRRCITNYCGVHCCLQNICFVHTKMQSCEW